MRPPRLLTSSQTMYSVSHASSPSPHLFPDSVLSLSCILPVSSPLHRPCTQSLMHPPRLPSSSQTMYSVSHASFLSPHLFTDHVLSLSCVLPVSPALHRQCTQSLMHPPRLPSSSQTMYSVSHASSLSPHLFTDHVLSLSCVLPVSPALQ